MYTSTEENHSSVLNADMSYITIALTYQNSPMIYPAFKIRPLGTSNGKMPNDNNRLNHFVNARVFPKISMYKRIAKNWYSKQIEDEYVQERRRPKGDNTRARPRPNSRGKMSIRWPDADKTSNLSLARFFRTIQTCRFPKGRRSTDLTDPRRVLERRLGFCGGKETSTWWFLVCFFRLGFTALWKNTLEDNKELNPAQVAMGMWISSEEFFSAVVVIVVVVLVAEPADGNEKNFAEDFLLRLPCTR